MRKKITILMTAVLIFAFVMGLAACTPYDKRPKPSINTENALENAYEIEEKAPEFGDPNLRMPTVTKFTNISRQKTLNSRLTTFNGMSEVNPETGKNEKTYNRYVAHQANEYIFSVQYFTAFDTTTTDRGVNMLVGSEISGTLMMNLPALLGNNQDIEEWPEFFDIFDEARAEQGAKEIEMAYMKTDKVSYVFVGEDLSDLDFVILYKVPEDTEQQEVTLKLNDIKELFTEKIQVYLSFTEDPLMAYEDYAAIITEYRESLAN